MTVDVAEFEGEAWPGPRCWWTARDFTPEQRAKLEEVLFRRPDISASTITRVIRSWDIKVDPQAVRRHRKHECLCD